MTDLQEHAKRLKERLAAEAAKGAPSKFEKPAPLPIVDDRADDEREELEA